MSGIIEKMQAEIDELKRKVAKLEGVQVELDEELIEKAIEEARKFNRQEDRNEIVERAKKDIEELSSTERFFCVPALDGGNESFYPEGCNDRFEETDGVRFVINSEKRTIVALIYYLDDEDVWARGIAKCAPDDCFNVHIGKAIALRRALGEEVPEEYLNAPAPEGVEVGDRILKEDGIWTVVNHFVTWEDIKRKKTKVGSTAANEGKVIDDSARYE